MVGLPERSRRHRGIGIAGSPVKHLPRSGHSTTVPDTIFNKRVRGIIITMGRLNVGSPGKSVRDYRSVELPEIQLSKSLQHGCLMGLCLLRAERQGSYF